MTQPVHPKDALFGGEKPFPIVPTCEHFAGTETLITKALALQDSLGPIFDITCDCEDGAPAGKERERRAAPAFPSAHRRAVRRTTSVPEPCSRRAARCPSGSGRAARSSAWHRRNS